MDWILIVVLVFALLEWIGEAKKNKKLIYLTKPVTMVALITWVLSVVLLANATLGNLSWFLVGLALCLVGDIFLMLPPEKWFISGLIAFLLGHIGYIIGFGVFSLVEGTEVLTIFLAVIILVVGIGIFKRLRIGLLSSSREKMIIPVAVYSLIISYMLFSAAYSFLDPEWNTAHAYIVISGALLFYISDILNAWERFILSYKNARPIIMSTYHLGQIALAVGATLHFLG